MTWPIPLSLLRFRSVIRRRTINFQAGTRWSYWLKLLQREAYELAVVQFDCLGSERPFFD